MANQNTIAIEIKVNDNGSAEIQKFSQNAGQSLNQVADSGNALSGVMKNMAGMLAAAFAVDKMVDFAKESILLAARVETLGVVLGVVGENAGYSRGEMSTYVDSVKKMGITTEAAHDAVIKIAQAQINVADSSKLARIAQDAAVIGNINSSEAFTRMINGIRSGGVEILETIGLNVNFEQGYVRMAQTLGKHRDALVEKDKAQARANVVMEAGIGISGAYEASMGTAGKMMLSMKRLTDELQLGFGQLFGGGLTDAVSGVTDLLKDMTKCMEDMRSSGAISDISDMVATGLKMAWISVKDVILAAWEVIKPIGPMINDVLPILGLVANGWGYILAILKPVGTVVGEILTSIFNIGKLVGSAFGALGAALAGDFNLAKSYATQLDTAWAGLSKSAKNAYEAVTDGVAVAIVAHKAELDAAVTTSMKKTAAELASEGVISKAKATSKAAGTAALQKDLANQKESADAAEEHAKKKEAAEKSIAEAVRKANVEIEGIGRTQYDKDISRITSQAQKYADAGASDIKVAEFVAAETAAAAEKASEAQIKASQKAGDAAAKLYTEIEKADEKLLDTKLKDSAKYQDMFTKEADFAQTENERAINKIIADHTKKVADLNTLQEGGNLKYSDYMGLLTKYNDNKNAAILEKESANALKIDKLNSDLISGIRGYEVEAYNARIKEINAKAAKDLLDSADYAKVMAKRQSDSDTAYINMGKTGDSFVAGVNAGFLEMERNAKTFGTVGYEIFNTFQKSSSDALSTGLFQAIKTGTVDAGTIWTSFADAMLKKFTDTMGQMVVEAALKKVVLSFGATWTDAAASVIGKVARIAGGALETWWRGSGSLGDSTAVIPGDARADGGPISANRPVWVGERGPELLFPQGPGYVMEHNQSVAYAAKSGGFIPGYADGGYYNYPVPTLNAFGPSDSFAEEMARYDGAYRDDLPIGAWIPRTADGWQDIMPGYYPYGFKPGDLINMITNQIAPGGDISKQFRDPTLRSGSGGGFGWIVDALTSIATGGGSTVATAVTGGTSVGTFIDNGGGSIYDWIHAFADPSGSVTGITEKIGANSPEWLTQIAGIVAPVIGAIWGPGGAAAGSGIMADWQAGAAGTHADRKTAMENAGMAAVLTYIMQGASGSGWSSGGEGGAGYGANLSSVAQSAAKNYAIKWGINQALGALFPAENGGLNINFDGMSGSPDLQPGLASIAPQSSQFAFSARNGLDYVPYDNFRINAHEGEAVLTKPSAESWRNGGSDGADFRAVADEIKGLRADLQQVNFRLLKNSSTLAQYAEKWDNDGLLTI